MKRGISSLRITGSGDPTTTTLPSFLAAASVWGLNRVLTGFALDLRPWLIAASLAGAVAIALVSGLYPAWRASTMTPLDT